MLVVLAAFVIGVVSAVLCLSQVLDRDRLREIGHRIQHLQFTIGQMMAAVVVAALLFHMFTARDGIISFWLLCLGFLFWFARTWQKEFVFLMGLKDGDFPGRHDKLIWAIMLLAFAPIGVWFFRVYRLAHWPEPATAVDGEGHAEANEAGGAATLPA